jgi:3-oxoacyl-[acyl-carrier protein] reductase|tara:strand:+ start:1965 stop:2708 length:744 start_codon:yes stop_codon:yes gene_type:complete
MLSNKTAFITGCNRGIGKSILDKFILNNANIICAVRKIDKDFLEYIENQRKNKDTKIRVIEIDLLDITKIKNSLQFLYDSKEKIDILVNNAGVADGSIFEMSSIEKIKEIFEINFFSQLKLTQLLIRFLKKSKEASIINMGSISGIIPERGTIGYGSSKASLMFATKVMANELSGYNIRVNAIAPNIIKTEMLNDMDTKTKEIFINQSFLKREGDVEDVSSLALYLASNESKYINGQIIRLDGGIKY